MRSSILLFCLLAFLDIVSAEWTTLAKRNSCPASSAEVGTISSSSAVADPYDSSVDKSVVDNDDYDYYGDDGNYDSNEDDYIGDDSNDADPTSDLSPAKSEGTATIDIPTDRAEISSILGNFATTGTPTSPASSTATGLEGIGYDLENVNKGTTNDKIREVQQEIVEEEDKYNASNKRSISLSKRGDFFNTLSATLRKVSDLAATWAPSSWIASKASDAANALEEADTLKTDLLNAGVNLLELFSKASQTVNGVISGTESPLEAIVAIINGAGDAMVTLADVEKSIKQAWSKLSTPTTFTTVVGSIETAKAGSSSDKSSSSDSAPQPASDALADAINSGDKAVSDAVDLWGKSK